MTKQIKILDTSVLLDDPTIVKKLPDSRIIIPFVVLKELDQKKSKQDEIGRNAREIIRILDSLKGDISQGVEIERNSTIEIYNNETKNNNKTVDEYIIETALFFLQEKEDVCLISQDINMRVRAKSLKIKSEPILESIIGEGSTNLNHKIYTGIGEIELNDDDLNIIMSGKNKSVNLAKYGDIKIYPNQFLKILNDDSESTYGIVKINDNKKLLHTIKNFHNTKNLDCKPKNIEQNLAINLMLDTDINLVSLSGRAGTGKTLLSLACALYLNRTEKKRIIITKPMVPVGRDLGFLPGNLEEKVNPYMGSIFDNLRYLVPDDGYLESMLEHGEIEISPIQLFRGRNLNNCLWVIDESQNCSKLEIKTLITRAGENTKIFLTSDPEQIDTPYLDSFNNGAVYAIEKLKKYEITGHITLLKGERSKLATLAAEQL